MIKSKLLLSITLLFVTFINAQTKGREAGLSSITEHVVKSQMEFLASDWTEGREMGTKGAYLASDYIKSMFKLYGLQPAGDSINFTPTRYEKLLGTKAEKNSSYFQNFSVIKYNASDNQELSLHLGKGNNVQTINFNYKTDFSVIPNDVSQQAKASVIFVGYGIKNEELKYNDFKGRNIEGKIIVRLVGYPGHLDSTSSSYKKFTSIDLKSLEKSKNRIAKELGAISIVEVNTLKDIALNWGENIPFRQNLPMYEGDTPLVWNYNSSYSLPKNKLEQRLPYFKVTSRVVNSILASENMDLNTYEKELSSNLNSKSIAIKNIQLSFKTNVISKRLNIRNVLGVIEGEDTENVVVVGAHYDHLGKYNGYIWNGADDNASGTVGIMTIARACMATGIKPKRTIIFAAWTGEERGLFGSRHFVKNYKNHKISVALNYDMISRDSDWDQDGTKCSMIYTKAFPKIESVTKKNNTSENLGLNINYAPMAKPIGGSDNSSFAEKNIPVFWFFIGSHEDYHRPSDHYEKANWKKFTNIIKLGFLNVWEFANAPNGIK